MQKNERPVPPALPTMTTKKEFETAFAEYTFFNNSRSLSINIKENVLSFDEVEFKRMVSVLKPNLIQISKIDNIDLVSGINDIDLLNDIMKKTGFITIPTSICLSKEINITNSSCINIKYLGNFIKLNCVGDLNEQSDITTWAHNLNDRDKQLFLTKIPKKQQILFMEEEQVMAQLYKEIINKYPNINSLSTEEKFEKIFDYICQTIPYCYAALTDDGKQTKDGYNWTMDPVMTYKRRTGVCKGRSHLIKMICNSSYFNIPCYVAEGKIGQIDHSWNEVVLNGIIYDFDSSFGKKYMQNIESKGYTYEHRDTFVKNLLKKQEEKRKRLQTPPPLPQ